MNSALVTAWLLRHSSPALTCIYEAYMANTFMVELWRYAAERHRMTLACMCSSRCPVVAMDVSCYAMMNGNLHRR